jgi:hypothetical protein
MCGTKVSKRGLPIRNRPDAAIFLLPLVHKSNTGGNNMKKKAKKGKINKELVEELKRVYDDVPEYVPLKKGQVIATFIKKGKKVEEEIRTEI